MDTQDVNGNDWLEYQPERCGGATDKGPTRAENQDAFWIPDQNTPTDLGALYLVADGVGGQQDGAVASKLAVETVQQVFYELRRQGEPASTALKEALEKANRDILEEVQKRQVRKMGSTFVGAVQDGDKLVVAHVGDARAYLIRHGELRQLTRDDTWVQRQVDAGLITEEEAADHEFRNVVTQVLGNKPEINIHLSTSNVLQPGDAVLLCSDGLYDVLPDRRMISLVTENQPRLAARLLVEAAIEADATDNITAVIMRTGSIMPMADDLTLAPLPVAIDADATLTGLALDADSTLTGQAVDTAPTKTTGASPTPAVAAKEKGRSPKWLIVLAVIAILLIVGTLFWFWLENRNVTEDSLDAAATELPLKVETPPTESAPVMRPINPSATAASLTDTPPPTVTLPLPNTPTPSPTVTIQAVSENRACVNSGPYSVWSENQVRTGNCDISFIGVEAGDEVRILDDELLLGGGTCGGAQFIKIQLAEEQTQVGWIQEELIDPVDPGESCSP